jgi:tripartite-type tricarboxylate transporter receptor subunit TctC
VATPSLPANNLQELIALSKRRKINVASSGTGAPTHLAMAEIAMATGMQWTHVVHAHLKLTHPARSILTQGLKPID